MIHRTGLEEAIRRAADPVVLTQRVADEAMTLVESVDGVLVGFVQDPSWLTFECGAGHLASQIGKRIPLEGTLAGLAFRTGVTVHSDDAAGDPRIEPGCRLAPSVRSLVCVPLWRHAQTAGVLCVASFRPRAFDERDVATLTSLAEFISVVITVAVDLAGVTDAFLSRVCCDAPGTGVPEEDDWAAETRFVANVLNPGALSRLETQRRIDRVLKGRGLSHVFQPVFDIKSGDCFAVEALARFSGRPKRSPDFWFAEAHALGNGVELEVMSAKGALRALSQLSGDIALCVNASPEAMISDGVRQLLERSEPGRVVMELTEEARVDDYPRLSRVLDQMRRMGVRLAIDDTGAGFASLAHILKLVPDFIKLDRELTSGIDHDPVRIALATALVSFASGLGAEIIAEGIETTEELEVLQGLDIRYGQGFLLCRPTSIDLIPARLPQEVWPASSTRAS
ncbi:MAG: EAL domain-containing protein [Acidimicrobiales bacterium]